MNIYKLNKIDITNLVIIEPQLKTRSGRLSNISASSIQVTVDNETNIFSPENINSLVYEYREDYSKMTLEVLDDKGEYKWHGIVENIERDVLGKVVISSSETIIDLLELESFEYNANDGYMGALGYAGDDVAPITHMLHFLRRFLPEELLDLSSFRAVEEIQGIWNIKISCSILKEDEKSPINFIKSLCMDVLEIILVNNKIKVVSFLPFKGDYGYFISDENILKITKIKKSRKAKTFSRYSVIWNNIGVESEAEDSLGVNGTSTNLTPSVLQDDTLSGDDLWEINIHRNKWVQVGVGATKELLYITGNNKDTLYFDGCTLLNPQSYIILNDNRIYSKDYYDFPIKLTNGASAIGASILLNQTSQKLEISLVVEDSFSFMEAGDSFTIDLPDEGLTMTPFCIININKNEANNTIIIKAIDITLYPLLNEYLLSKPDTPLNLVGYREENGNAVLNWDMVLDVAYYKIYMGTSDYNLSLVLIEMENFGTVYNLYTWLGYYFQVSCVNYAGVESDKSNMIFLDANVQEAGYIDGTDGYFFEKYIKWGILEDYFYNITYKGLDAFDIKTLSKSKLVILDRSQSQTTEDVTQGWAVEELDEDEAREHRALGYVDGAGTSTYLPEFFWDTAPRIVNAMNKSLTLGGVVYPPWWQVGTTNDWFLKDSLGNYMTYWFETGYMMDPSNADMIEWFKVWKVDRTMGVFDKGNGNLIFDGTRGVLTDLSQSWIVDQWVDYYVGLFEDEDSKVTWYKILNNGTNYLWVVTPDDLEYSGRFVINSDLFRGFDGLFMDDIWDSIYREGREMSLQDENSSCDWAGDTWLTDNSKNWTTGQWAGYCIEINDSGVWLAITDNSASIIWFSGNTEIGTPPYKIRSKFFVDNGITYGESFADLIDEITLRVEQRSVDFHGHTFIVENGCVMLNTWCNDWAVYDDYISKLNTRYRHFVMFEALQSTWNMANEVTKQFMVKDWQEVIDRWDNMKKSGEAGRVKLAVLGYPHTIQMYISLIIGSIMLSRYSNIIEDVVQGSNVVLQELFYDMIQAGNKDTTHTLGVPDEGYENHYDHSIYDPYSLCIRRLKGATIFYNPARKIQKVIYIFPEDSADFWTGNELEGGEENEILLLPRQGNIFYRQTEIGYTAKEWLAVYKPFTTLNNNTAWIVFTPAGSTAVGNKSIWIYHGHGSIKRIITDGTGNIPEGEFKKLFHAGNDSSTIVNGYTPLVEGIIGVLSGQSVTLTSLSIYSVVYIWNVTDGSPLQLGIDYSIEYCEGDASVGGKGKWETKIHSIADLIGLNLNVYYFEQGLDGEGYPDGEYSRVEHGVLYRHDEEFKLYSGVIDEEESPCDSRYAACFVKVGDDIAYFGLGYKTDVGWKNDWWKGNLKTGKWEQKNNVTFSAMGAGISVYDSGNDIVYAGLGRGAGGLNSNIYKYDSILDSWPLMTNMTTPRAYCVAEFYNDFIYVGLGEASGACLNDFWKYDTIGNSWTQLDDLPGDGVKGAWSVIRYGYIYVGGGKKYNGLCSNNFYRFDISGESWVQLPNQIPASLVYSWACTDILNNIYIGGGLDLNDDAYQNCFKNDFNNAWEEIKPLSSRDKTDSYYEIKNYTSKAIFYDGHIYLGSGIIDYEDTFGSVVKDTNRLFRNKISIDEWNDELKMGVSPLVENVDFFIIPEIIRWKWDYRYKINFPTELINQDYVINIKDITTKPDQVDVEGIQWGIVNPDNLILIDPEENSEFTYNGKKANYDKKYIRKPRVLLYGFSDDVKDASGQTIPVASRVYNKWRTENQIKEFEGVYYDKVIITGGTSEASGDWGSIQGYADEMGYTGASAKYQIIQDFDVIIICETFEEASAASPSGRAQWSSWLDEIDYGVLKLFQSAYPDDNKLIIDRRFGMRAFAWWGGIEPVKNILINRSYILEGTLPDYTDLTDVFGFLWVGSLDFSLLCSDFAKIYLDEDGLYKFNSNLKVDLRIFNDEVSRVTDHYAVDVEEEKFPIYNIWEQGGSYISYIPKSSYYRDDKFLENSKLYVQRYNMSNLNSDWIEYDSISLGNIFLRKENALIWHCPPYDQAEAVEGDMMFVNRNTRTKSWGWPFSPTEWDLSLILIPEYLTGGQNLSDFLWSWFSSAPFQDLYKSEENWTGFKGFPIAETSYKTHKDSFWILESGIRGGMWLNNQQENYGAAPPFSMNSWAMPRLFFSSWEDSIQSWYFLSKSSSGKIPRDRVNRTYEFKIDNVEKEGGNILKIRVFDTEADCGVGTAQLEAEYNSEWKAMIIPITEEAKIIGCFEAPLVTVDGNDIRIVLPRGETIPTDLTELYLGVIYIMAPGELDMTEALGGLKIIADMTQSSQVVMGGVDGNDIPLEIYSDNQTPPEKPRGMVSYDYAFNNLTDEFAFDFSTGLLTGQAFFKSGRNKPPTVVWSGISLNDIHILIRKWIGIDITFTDLSVEAGKDLLVYYNSLNDMLHIDYDKTNEFPFPDKVEGWTHEQIVKNKKE